MHYEKTISRVLPTFTILGALIVTLGWSLPSQAARITTLSKTGKTVLIDTEGADLQEGDKFFVMIGGKKKAVVVIEEVKRGRAKGKVTKGKAALDGTLEPVSQSVAKNGSGGAAIPRRKGKGRNDSGSSGTYIGVMAGYAMDNQNVTGTTTASMTGSGYSIKAFGDLPISGSLGVIARTGLEQVNFTGTTGTINRQTAILYYTGDLLLRYSFSDRGFMPYIGGGLGLHYPISKSSDILNPDRIATTFVFFIPSVGFNMQMSNSMILTAVAEYAMFPPSSEVSTYFYTVRAGVGWKF